MIARFSFFATVFASFPFYCGSVSAESDDKIIRSADFWDPIPPSPSTAPPDQIADDYWRGQFERVNQTVRESDGCDLVFLGDSITWHWSLGQKTGESLWNKEYVEFQPINMGNSGDITPVMLYRVTHGNLDFPKAQQPKVAVLLAGTNNFVVQQSAGGKVRWQLGPECPPEEVAAGARAIAQVIRRRLPETRVIMLGILPVSNEAKWEKCQHVNATHASLNANANELVYLNLQDRFLLPDGSLDKRLFSDGTHLTEQGYRAWADGLDPALQEWMKAEPLKPVRIMLLGGRITEGADSAGSYRRYLDGMLRRKGHVIDFVGSRSAHGGGDVEPSNYEYDIDHEGHWGKTSEWLAAELPALLAPTPPDVVAIHVGEEDFMVKSGEAEQLADEIVGNIGQMVATLRLKNPNVQILLTKILALPGKAAEAQRLNEKLEQYALKHTQVKSAIRVANLPTGVTVADPMGKEGILPTPEGARNMAEVFAVELERFMTQPRD